MATDRDAALLAHISDTVTDLREEQSTILAVLTRLLEIGEAQTVMLSEILTAARQDPEPSEAAQQLAALVEVVQENTAAIVAMAEQMAVLPAEIGAEVADALEDAGSEPGEE